MEFNHEKYGKITKIINIILVMFQIINIIIWKKN